MFWDRLEKRFGQSGWWEAGKASCCNCSLSPAQRDEDFAGTSLTQSINNNMVCSVFKSVTFSLNYFKFCLYQRATSAENNPNASKELSAAGPGEQHGSSAAPECQHSLEKLTVTAASVLLSKLLFYLSSIANYTGNSALFFSPLFFFFPLFKRSDKIGLL